MPAERLQKLIAAAGIASRRHAEALIVDGRVTVNGRTITAPGTKADPVLDDIRVDGRPLVIPRSHTYLAMHKPAGILTAVSDSRGRRTVIDLLPPGTAHVLPVGRLDLDSEGLLLLTDDGDLALRLTHPRYGAEKEYVAVTAVAVPDGILEQLRAGVEIDGSRTAPAVITPLPAHAGLPGDRTYRVVLHEGRNRQVRKMFATERIRVERLIRVRVGPVLLGMLAPGDVRALSRRELSALGVTPRGTG